MHRTSTWTLVALLFLPVAGLGCKFRPEPPPELPKVDLENELPPPDLNPVKDMSIGDVEAVVEIRGTVAEESLSDSVGADEYETPKKRLTLVRTYVKKPYPAQLWLDIGLSDIYGYNPRPVVVRGKVLRQVDDGAQEVIEELNSVIGVDVDTVRTNPEVFGPRALKLDVLGDLPAPPKTMLILVEAQAMLLPQETDLSKLDPANTTAPPTETTTLRSNPIRIDFLEEETAQPGAGG